MSREPYCSHCGYKLVGLTESSKCPECGRPIVDVLVRPPLQMGRRYKSQREFCGLPLLHIAIGPYGGERVGRARGVVAIGDVATGFVALGTIARGGIAFGALAFGGLALGGLGIGVVSVAGAAVGLAAMGGLAVGGLAVGGLAVGGIAVGGCAIGVVADGGAAIGSYVRGGAPIGPHRLGLGVSDPEAARVFGNLRWLLGAQSGGGIARWVVAATPALGLIIALLGAVVARCARMRRGGDTE